MQAFLIHRTFMRSEAELFLASLRDSDGIFVEASFLEKFYGNKWRQQAESKMLSSEVVIIFDHEACEKSKSTSWEIKRAKQLGKPLISLSRSDIESRDVGELQAAYDFSDDFDSCFEKKLDDPTQLLELYKIMVTSSEQLIHRRQITNGFFITVIGAIVGISGIVIEKNTLTGNSILILLFPLFIGLLMCRSWRNLIENYGRLNAGKFLVIHRMEKLLDARIFKAEWIALGKGLQNKKYKSFTSTEQNVPKLFSYLLCLAILLTLWAADWKHVMSSVDAVRRCL